MAVTYQEGQPYECEKCGEVTVGTYKEKIYYCWTCYEEEVQLGNIEVKQPYPVNWGRIIEK